MKEIFLNNEIKKALSVLPEENQKVIQLHFIDKIPRKEIAKTLNWSLSTVNTKITGGITLLRAELNPDHFKDMDNIIEKTNQRLLRK